MSKKEKLIKRLKNNPTDFTCDEAKALLTSLEYYELHKGKTSGSRVCFYNKTHGMIQMHKPHPSNILKSYQVKLIKEKLEKEKQIWTIL